tara:strand:+ start:43 stop:504 length:462 start_codon:yes stop_codon:yes gene_type:complete
MNQVAEQINNKIQISAVLPKDIFLIWTDINKFLERSCKRSNGRHTVDTIYKQLINNQAHLWVIYNTEEDTIKGCVVTNFMIYPTGLKMLNILQLAGKNMEDWIEVGKPVLLNWAKTNNCHGIEAVGREGMSNWLGAEDKNWKKNNLLFEIQFN